MLLVLLLYIGLSFYGTTVIPLSSSQTEVSDLQARVDILRSLTEAIAIVVAGVWAYEVYIKNRYDHPYPKIQHRIEHHELDARITYVSVFVTVTNEGKTKLPLGNGRVFIRQVVPIRTDMKQLIADTISRAGDEVIRRGEVKNLFVDGGQRLGWITLGSRSWNQLREGLKDLEPGQTREIQFDFLLIGDDDVDVIEAISYFEYAKSSWELATLYSLENSVVSPAFTDKA